MDNEEYFEPREIVIAHAAAWKALEAFLSGTGLELVRGPEMNEGETPWYFIGIKNS